MKVCSCVMLQNDDDGNVSINDSASLSGGRVGLTQTSFTVRENESEVVVCAEFTKYNIRPNCPMEVTININITAAGIFACILSSDQCNNVCIMFVLTVTPDDFFSLQDILSFSQPVHTECRAVFLDNDLQVEPTENFYVSLTTTDSRIRVDPSQGVITILYDDCE